jgi:hypothetical protein
MTSILCAALIVASMGADAIPSHAQSYLPLAVGNRWTYDGVSGHEVRVITGTATVRGRAMFVMSFEESAGNEGLDNYWLIEPDGDVLLGGFFRNVEHWGLAYDPPVRMVNVPLSVGAIWTTPVSYYTLPDTTLGGTFDITMEVFGDSVLTVPAGTFSAFGIGQSPQGGAPAVIVRGAFELDGTVQVAGGSAQDWYSDGVGDVQFGFGGDQFKLTSYAFPTPTSALSWGRLKRLYR